ncbi:HNH endonuclease signature motif containing protein [Nocardia yunnanensis]|nr:HNH endonuclease signature motif containing protein [Nocardia yunnanensis]
MGDIADEIATAQAVVARLRVVHSQVAAWQAEEVSLMTALYHLRREQQLECGVAYLQAGESTATEIGIALKVSQRSADELIELGLGLQNRYPATRDAFADGRIDLARVRAISKVLTNASDGVLDTLEAKVAAYAEKVEPARVRRTANRWIKEVDPAGQAERRKDAEADRYVTVTAADNGTAVVDAVLPAAGGEAVFERLREMALSQVCGKDPRTTNQRRADALVALADGTGRLVCQCGREDCPRAITGEVPVPRKALVQVGVSAETLAGLQDNPALLAGFGAIDADLARQIARHARFEIITDTTAATAVTGETTTATAATAVTGETTTATAATAAVTGETATATTESAPAATESAPATTGGVEKAGTAAELRYRPGARIARRARAIDGSCRAPGCQVPAAASDLDHQDRFDHTNPAQGGRTTEANLGARCRRHHRLKTLADNHANGWTVIHHPDRRVEWRTPTGESDITTPEGPDYLFPATPVPPVTAAGVPDAEPLGSVFDPGVAATDLIEMVMAYTTPSQRKAARRARNNK